MRGGWDGEWTYDGGFDGETEREGKDVSVVFFTPGRAVYAVMRVEENEETRGLDGFPDRI